MQRQSIIYDVQGHLTSFTVSKPATRTCIFEKPRYTVLLWAVWAYLVLVCDLLVQVEVAADDGMFQQELLSFFFGKGLKFPLVKHAAELLVSELEDLV